MARVNWITQFLPATHTTILTSLRKHSPDGTTRTRRHTSDIAYYSIYRPLKDERLSWPSWLTYSGRLTHISGHQSAAGRALDRKVRRSKTNVLTTATQPTKVLPLLFLLLFHYNSNLRWSAQLSWTFVRRTDVILWRRSYFERFHYLNCILYWTLFISQKCSRVVALCQLVLHDFE